MYLFMQFWSWKTNKSHMVHGQINMNHVTLGCCTWQQTSSRSFRKSWNHLKITRSNKTFSVSREIWRQCAGMSPEKRTPLLYWFVYRHGSYLVSCWPLTVPVFCYYSWWNYWYWHVNDSNVGRNGQLNELFNYIIYLKTKH